MFPRLRSFLTALMRRDRFEEELDEEVQFHLDAYTEELVRAGVSRREATRHARLRFGSIGEVKDGCRQLRGLRLVDGLERMMTNIKLILRMLLRRTDVSVVAIVALALGIGLTASMFSIVYSLILKGLPYEQPDDLVAVNRTRPAQNLDFVPVTIHDFEDWRDQQSSFEQLVVWAEVTVNISGTEGRPVRYLGARTSSELFDLLRVRPILGRTFGAEEDHPSASPVMVLSHRAWQDRFGGDPDIVGRAVRANSELTTIVGVMPERFDFPGTIDVWIPLRVDPLQFPRGSGPDWGNTALQAIGRLKSGISIEEAQADMTTIAARIESDYPNSNEGIGVAVRPVLESFLGSPLIALLYSMLIAVFGVLVISCVNVTNLLLVRVVQRTSEMAIRTALGSGRASIILQVLAEAFLLSAIGAVIGLGLANLTVDYFNSALETLQPPLWLTISLDPASVAFVVGLTLLTTLGAGIVPALRASRTNVNEILNDESRGSSGTRIGWASNGLVVAQIALSCGLLLAAGLMIRTVVNTSHFDYGFPTGNLFTARLGLLDGDYPTAEDRRQFYDALLGRLGTQPRVRAASLTSHLPAQGGSMQRLSVSGVAYSTELDHPEVQRAAVSPDYFDVLEVVPLRGRVFDVTDTPGTAPVTIVNQQFAALHLDGDPIGQQIKLGGDEQPWRTIIGVVPDLHMGGIGSIVGGIGGALPRHEGVYVPLSQDVPSYVSIVIRTDQAPMTLTAAVQESVAALDGRLPLYWVRSLNEEYARNAVFYGVFGTLFAGFAIAALLLAMIGLYGTMSFAVNHRTREIGVRMALGAQDLNVLLMVLARGARQLMVGLFLGLILGSMLFQGLQAILFNVSPWDATVTVVIIAGAFCLAGFVACVVPARRAARVSPMEVFR